MPHLLRASCAWGLTIAFMLTAGCRSLAFEEVARGAISVSIDGLALPAEATSTTREVVSMLALAARQDDAELLQEEPVRRIAKMAGSRYSHRQELRFPLATHAPQIAGGEGVECSVSRPQLR